ncbi:hypothetical protein L195_g034796 [Trifolium pratense]|uniref:Uncharacterized protein n=1 Tax=Trifolium pratense TaxID=57577 RepID=A0A2K3LJV6_TRIPR|nr:hypothetical protein L195_g034796 [Trifolium pratense]
MRRPPLSNNFIATMANRITNLGFPTNIFDFQTYVLSGYLDKNFASLLRLLSPYNDDQKLEKVLLLGVKLNFFNSFANCQPNEFYTFMKHLRTPAGQGELKKIAVQERLEKRAAARGFTVHEMAYVALAEIPVSDFLKPKHEIRRKLCEEIIAEYQKNQLKIAQLAHPTLDCAEGDRSGTLAVEENVQGSGVLDCAEDDQSGTLAVEKVQGGGGPDYTGV